jgi:AraC-like DNA-binding protein
MLETSKSRYQNPELLNSLAASITHLIAQSVLADTRNTVSLYDRFEIDRAIAYMNSHFPEKITIDQIAEQVHLSEGYFSRIFKSITGETPIDFLKSLRLQKACNMLMNQQEYITDIALKCGFQSASYFSTCFLEQYRMTPSVYRQRVLKVKESSEY